MTAFDARTDGETQNCAGCRFWSEMMARASGNVIEAVCLNPESRNHMKWPSERMTCAAWKSGFMGAIDAPGMEGGEYEALEVREDLT